VLKNIIRKKIIRLRKKKFKTKYKISIKKIIDILKLEKNKKLVFGGYFTSNYEIDCLSILEQLQNKGFKTSLPVIKNNKQMDFYLYKKFDPLIINQYGIPEPNPINLVLPDVIFVPLVAYDKFKFRIGYGGGYYDRYLSKLDKKKNIKTIGFAFSFQKIQKVPTNKFDKKLDLILNEQSVLI
tara:strand:- start:224 stop:769 length:546 start_codon:yes stop_codon:yes gene_type:complete